MKTHPLEEFLNTSESKAVVVLLWIMKNRDEQDLIHTTLDTVAKECQVTKVTVNRVFQRLYAAGFMKKIRNGKYQVFKI